MNILVGERDVNEITKKVNLLDDEGNLLVRAYSTRSNFIYNIDKAISFKGLRETEYYMILGVEKCLQMGITHTNNKIKAMISLVSIKDKRRKTFTKTKYFKIKGYLMPDASSKCYKLVFINRKFSMMFDVNDNIRHLTLTKTGAKPTVLADIVMESENNCHSVLSTHLKDKSMFCLLDHENGLISGGMVNIGGNREIFNSGSVFGFASHERVRTTRKWERFWLCGAIEQNDGKTFGINLGWGMGDEDGVSENMVFVDSQMHKLGNIVLKDEVRSVIEITSDDGRLVLFFKPSYSDTCNLRDATQSFGLASGEVILDDGNSKRFIDMNVIYEHIKT